VHAVGEPASEDLTARARIRDAAVTLIADGGAETATIRRIAAAAGVSGGLVRHHFGSKDDLRAACDAWVLAQLVRFKEEAVLGEGAADPGFLAAAHPGVLLLLRYMARSIVDGSPAAEAMYAALVGTTEAWIADHHPGQTSDVPAYAALLMAMEVGALVLHAQLSRALGADVLTPEGHLRLVRAKVELYSKPLLDPELAAGALAAIDRLREAPRAAGHPPAGSTG
jgi:AcrR family transcriptional regulator